MGFKKDCTHFLESFIYLLTQLELQCGQMNSLQFYPVDNHDLINFITKTADCMFNNKQLSMYDTSCVCFCHCILHLKCLDLRLFHFSAFASRGKVLWLPGRSATSENKIQPLWISCSPLWIFLFFIFFYFSFNYAIASYSCQ